MSKFLALCAFVGVLVQSGNLGVAIVGAIFIWLWTINGHNTLFTVRLSQAA